MFRAVAHILCSSKYPLVSLDSLWTALWLVPCTYQLSWCTMLLYVTLVKFKHKIYLVRFIQQDIIIIRLSVEAFWYWCRGLDIDGCLWMTPKGSSCIWMGHDKTHSWGHRHENCLKGNRTSRLGGFLRLKQEDELDWMQEVKRLRWDLKAWTEGWVEEEITEIERGTAVIR